GGCPGALCRRAAGGPLPESSPRRQPEGSGESRRGGPGRAAKSGRSGGRGLMDAGADRLATGAARMPVDDAAPERSGAEGRDLAGRMPLYGHRVSPRLAGVGRDLGHDGILQVEEIGRPHLDVEVVAARGDEDTVGELDVRVDDQRKAPEPAEGRSGSELAAGEDLELAPLLADHGLFRAEEIAERVEIHLGVFRDGAENLVAAVQLHEHGPHALHDQLVLASRWMDLRLLLGQEPDGDAVDPQVALDEWAQHVRDATSAPPTI